MVGGLHLLSLSVVMCGVFLLQTACHMGTKRILKLFFVLFGALLVELKKCGCSGRWWRWLTPDIVTRTKMTSPEHIGSGGVPTIIDFLRSGVPFLEKTG